VAQQQQQQQVASTEPGSKSRHWTSTFPLTVAAAASSHVYILAALDNPAFYLYIPISHETAGF